MLKYSSRERNPCLSTAAKSRGSSRRRVLESPWRVGAKLDTQAGATLAAAAAEDGAATLRLHAGTKAVCALALQDAWLECAFHGRSVESFVQCAGENPAKRQKGGNLKALLQSLSTSNRVVLGGPHDTRDGCG